MLYVDNSCWAKAAILSRQSLPNHLTYLVDGAQFTKENFATFQYNYSSLSFDMRCSLYTTVNHLKFNILSICSIYSSSLWLERELSDFTNITFNGIQDTRRLLLDYFQEKKNYKTHVANFRSYSSTYYEVTVNY